LYFASHPDQRKLILEALEDSFAHHAPVRYEQLDLQLITPLLPRPDWLLELGVTEDQYWKLIGTLGNFTWVPALNQPPGDYSATFTATDHLLPQLSDTQSVAIHVDKPSLPPSLAAIRDWTIDDETLLTFKANATDPNIPPETLTFSLGPDAPLGASISLDGVFYWTPTEAQSGIYRFTVTVSNSALTDSKTVSITVAEVEQPPVLTVPGAQTVDVGTLLIFTVSATNPDADDLATLSASGLPSGASFDSDLGSFVWTPGNGQGPGVYTVTFKAVEPGPMGFSDTKTVTITVEKAASSSGQPFGVAGRRSVPTAGAESAETQGEDVCGAVSSARWLGGTTAGFHHFRRYPLDRPNLAGAARRHSGARAAASGTAAHHFQVRIHAALAELPAHDDDPAHTS